MNTQELEVYITPDGLGRAAIVRRPDGLLCIYVHWIWSDGAMESTGLQRQGPSSWHNDKSTPSELYADVRPEPGLYGTLDDARRQIRSLNGFSEALLKSAEEKL